MRRGAAWIVPALGTVLVVAVAAGAYIYSGAYDIGADAPHSAAVIKTIDILRERSVDARVKDIVPPDLTRQDMVAEGAEHYSEMCTGCHLSPGQTDSELRAGLYPQPPDLSRNPVSDPREAFWIIKHGVKMSAMPAWGGSHSDSDIWNIVAFLNRMPSMSPEQYNALVSAAGGETGHEHGEHHHDDHGEHHSMEGLGHLHMDE